MPCLAIDSSYVAWTTDSLLLAAAVVIVSWNATLAARLAVAGTQKLNSPAKHFAIGFDDENALNSRLGPSTMEVGFHRR
jgi:hypothetical protein